MKILLVIAAGIVAGSYDPASAKTIYVAVSNPDMSFLSGGRPNLRATSKTRGSTSKSSK
jgi:hypothetical protein